jgi:prohibitin 1
MERAFNAMQKIGGGMIVAGIVVAQFTFVVDGGERALIMDATRGLRPGVYGEGMHFRIPIIHQVKTFQVRSQPMMIPSSTGTRDL